MQRLACCHNFGKATTETRSIDILSINIVFALMRSVLSMCCVCVCAVQLIMFTECTLCVLVRYHTQSSDLIKRCPHWSTERKVQLFFVLFWDWFWTKSRETTTINPCCGKPLAYFFSHTSSVLSAGLISAEYFRQPNWRKFLNILLLFLRCQLVTAVHVKQANLQLNRL